MYYRVASHWWSLIKTGAASAGGHLLVVTSRDNAPFNSCLTSQMPTANLKHFLLVPFLNASNKKLPPFDTFTRFQTTDGGQRENSFILKIIHTPISSFAKSPPNGSTFFCEYK